MVMVTCVLLDTKHPKPRRACVCVCVLGSARVTHIRGGAGHTRRERGSGAETTRAVRPSL